MPRALASVFAQDFEDFEVLVIDDGSQDQSLSWLSAQNEARLRVLQSHGAGVSAARNLGITHAHGAFIALLDSDDAWLPKKLSLQLRALEKNPHAALCHTDEIWIRSGKRVNACKHHEKSGGDVFSRCLERCVISPSSALIRREIFSQVGLFDERLPVCEDYDLWLRICSGRVIAYLEEPLTVKYGGHADQLSRRYPVMDQYRVQALEKLLRNTLLSDRQRAQVFEMLARKCRIIELGARKRGRHQVAAEYGHKFLEYSQQADQLRLNAPPAQNSDSLPAPLHA